MNVILVAGEEAGGRQLEQTIQQAPGGPHEVKRALGLDDTLKHLEHVGTQAVILDLTGPTGCEALRSLRVQHPYLPLIALVDRAENPLALEALRAGAEDVLAKIELTPSSLSRAILYAIERTMLHQELKERNDEYRLIVDTAEEGIWTIDAQDRTVFVNRKMAALLGYSTAEMLGRTPLDFMDAEGRAIAIPKLATKRQGVVDQLELEFIRKDGSKLSTSITTSPILDNHGRYHGAMALITDATERKAQQEKLHRLAALVDSSSDAIIGKDLQDVIVSWNLAAEKLFGYTAAEAVGRSIRFIVPPDRQEEIDGILATLRRGEAVPAFESVRKCRDGRLINVSVTVSPVRDSLGRTIGSSAIIRDISAQKNLEAQFRQAQKMEAIGRLAGGVAHDFNNLLTVICGYTSMALARPLDGSFKQELEEVFKAGERAAALTRQLLAFSRKQLLEPQVLELNPIITNLEKMLRRLIGEDIQLTTTLQKDLAKVKVDPGQIEQVIMNLTVNARDAMPQGGRLLIETRMVEIEKGSVGLPIDVPPGSYVVMAVSDTGVGMDKEVQSRLFEPFFTTKGLGKGTGLGLSTIYGIVRQSGGFITVYSEPGKGSTFKVYLPSTNAKSKAPSAPGEPAKSLTGTERILVVEDDPVLLKLTCQILSANGYRVEKACDAAEALAWCSREGFPDLLLTDMVLAGMDGLTLCRTVARQKCGIKRIIMTGYTEEAMLHQGVSESGIPVLHKPFTPRALLTAVRGMLGNSPAPRPIPVTR